MELITATLPMPVGSLSGISRGLWPLKTARTGRVWTAARSSIFSRRKRGTAVVNAGSADYEFGAGDPSIVDANMIALRKRISELRMQERNWNAPEDWTEWEKQFYPTYHRRICETMGLLQNYLMYTRPSVAIATLTLVSLGVAASVSLVLIYAVVFSAEFIHNG